MKGIDLRKKIERDIRLFCKDQNETMKFYIQHIDYFIFNFPYFKDIEILSEFFSATNTNFSTVFLEKFLIFSKVIFYKSNKYFDFRGDLSDKDEIADKNYGLDKKGVNNKNYEEGKNGIANKKDGIANKKDEFLNKNSYPNQYLTKINSEDFNECLDSKNSDDEHKNDFIKHTNNFSGVHNDKFSAADSDLTENSLITVFSVYKKILVEYYKKLSVSFLKEIFEDLSFVYSELINVTLCFTNDVSNSIYSNLGDKNEDFRACLEIVESTIALISVKNIKLVNLRSCLDRNPRIVWRIFCEFKKEVNFAMESIFIRRLWGLRKILVCKYFNIEKFVKDCKDSTEICKSKQSLKFIYQILKNLHKNIHKIEIPENIHVDDYSVDIYSLYKWRIISMGGKFKHINYDLFVELIFKNPNNSFLLFSLFKILKMVNFNILKTKIVQIDIEIISKFDNFPLLNNFIIIQDSLLDRNKREIKLVDLFACYVLKHSSHYCDHFYVGEHLFGFILDFFKFFP